MKKIDLVNKKFGKLMVLEFAYLKNGRRFWKCKCDCGNISLVYSGNLTASHTQSCGCIQKETCGQMGNSRKNITAWNKDKASSQMSKYKNMAKHLRFDIKVEWLLQFKDLQKLQFLNTFIIREYHDISSKEN